MVLHRSFHPAPATPTPPHHFLQYFYRDLPCVDYASWPEDGSLVIAIDDWGNDQEYYGGCVYGKTLHGSGNYSATMAPFSRTDTGFVSAFYMYSDDDDCT